MRRERARTAQATLGSAVGHLRAARIGQRFLWAPLAILSAGCVEGDLAATRAGSSNDNSSTRSPSEAAAVGASTLYFFAPGCPDCEIVERTVVPELTGRGIELVRLDVETPEGFGRLREIERRFSVQVETLAPIVVHEGRVLRGPEEIAEYFLEGEAREGTGGQR